jgi:nucleolar complex protein 2
VTSARVLTMARVSKSTKKFTASGKLKKTIQARRKHQQVKKRIRDKKAVKAVDGRAPKDEVTGAR